MPTPAQREAHELTHFPFRRWCEHCVRGQATGDQHRSVSSDMKMSTVQRLHMDYGFLKEDGAKTEDEHGVEESARLSLTMLVTLETLCGSVWAYALESKSAVVEKWVATQISEDVATVGLHRERIIAKSDQEPAILELQKEIARQRAEAGTGIENSGVGDSNRNGKIERAIRDVKGIIRTLRSWLSMKLGVQVKLDDPVVPWLVRHAAYIITRCLVKSD